MCPIFVEPWRKLRSCDCTKGSHSLVSINTLNPHLNQYLMDIPMDSQPKPHRSLINSQLIVGRVSTYSYDYWSKMWFRLTVKMLMDCQLRCWLSADRLLIEGQSRVSIDTQQWMPWLWRWLLLKLSRRQSPTTVLFRTTLTRTITTYMYELDMDAFSAHDILITL